MGARGYSKVKSSFYTFRGPDLGPQNPHKKANNSF